MNRNRARENAPASNESWLQCQMTDNVNNSAKGPIKAGSVMGYRADAVWRSSGESTAEIPHRWPVGDRGQVEGRH